MFSIAKYEDIEEIPKLRVVQQKDDWKGLYPNKDEEFYIITKNYLEEHLKKDIFFLKKIEIIK